MDTSKPGRVVAKIMDDLQQEYEGQEGEVEIGTVVVVVEVRAKDVDTYESETMDETEGFASRVHVRSNDARHWVQVGLLDYAKEGMRATLHADDDEEDDE
jgi:hypothetical protein